MKFAYEDLSDKQFETLIVLVCQRLFGIAVQGFSEGPDGGRDAKFVGTAELHPSMAAPWTGTTVIQAKHTNGYNKSFSERDFHSADSENTVLGKEIPRIKRLRVAKQLNNYILFANRRLAGNAETEIRSHISTQCGIPVESISVFGLEQIELLLRRFSDIPAQADLDPIDSPLTVSPDDLAEVVLALARNKERLAGFLDDPPTARIPYDEKNKTNGMSESYARAQRRKYLKEASQIRMFLAAPENLDLLRRYESATDEFQLKIIAKRKDYQSFDEVMEYLVNQLFDRDAILRQHGNKRLTRAMVFYMYWNCDIGEPGDAATNQALSS